MAKPQAVILAAGESTRTIPLTLTRPKPLLKIANKTLLEHNFDQLLGLVGEAIIVVGYKKEMIIEHFGNSYKGLKLTYVEQKEQLGTGHAVLQVKSRINGKFLVMNGDDLYSKQDIKAMLQHKYAVVGKKIEEDISKQGGAITEKNGFVTGIVERPKNFISKTLNVGMYVFDEEIFNLANKIRKSERNEYEITDVVTALAKTDKIKLVEVKDYWLPVGYPWQVIEANEYLLKNKMKPENKGIIEKNVTIKGQVSIGDKTLIRSGVYIEGPVMIGKNCVIGPNCYLRPGTTIGDNCKIGQAVEIKNSVIMDKTNVPHLSYVGDSVIGEKCNLGAGTIVANLKHDNGNVRSVVRGLLIDTGRRKLGAILGDNVHTGINTSIYPGRKIWPNRTTVPGEVVRKDIE
ncbi:MAG: sugar phosphate nucleotidyltransferase [Nanoarchaeota archaeon]|nr:sugar phosphate nucleotidyltransferase [Nanoarchaeota archaeon]